MSDKKSNCTSGAQSGPMLPRSENGLLGKWRWIGLNNTLRRVAIDFIELRPVGVEQLEKLVIIAFVANTRKVLVEYISKPGLLIENGQTNEYVEAHESHDELQFVPLSDLDERGQKRWRALRVLASAT